MAKGDMKKNLQGSLETMDELLFASRDFTEEAKKQAQILFSNKEQVNATTKGFRDLAKTTSDIASTIKEVYKGNVDVNDLNKQANKLAKQKAKYETEYRQALNKAGITQKEIKSILSGQVSIQDILMEDGRKFQRGQIDLLDIYDQQNKILGEQDVIYKDLTRRANNIEGSMGMMGTGLKGVGGILKKAGFGDLADKMGIDEAITKGKELGVELSEGGNKAVGLGGKFKIAAKMAGSITDSLLASLGPIALIGKAISMIWEGMKKVDKEAGALAKDLGVSYDRALELGEEFREMAHAYGDTRVHGEDIAKAQSDLNKAFGTSAKFTGGIAEDMASVQKRTQLSDDAMGFYAKNAMKSGKPIKQQLANITKTVLQQNKQRKLVMGMKQVQEAIAKTSNMVKLHAKGNVAHLTKSVMAAKELGASMETIEGIGSSLLDFESSIAAELEAELLLGQDINLEKARAFALEGNMLGLTEEILKNKAIMKAFDDGNVIQQEAAAKALGLNRSELANMIMEQANLNALQSAFGDDVTNMNEAQKEYNRLVDEGKLTDEMKKQLGEEGLLDQLASTAEAEKFADLQKGMMEDFAKIGKMVLDIYHTIKDWVGGGKNLLKIVGGIFGVYKLIKGIQAVSLAIAVAKGAQDKANLITQTSAVGRLVAQAAAWAIMNPIPALIGAGIAAGIGALVYSQMEDGVIGPGGEMVVSGPKGSIQLDKNDSIIAGTNLGGGEDKKGGNRIKALLNEQNSILTQILNKSIVIEMSGNEVGQGINTAEREIQ